METYLIKHELRIFDQSPTFSLMEIETRERYIECRWTPITEKKVLIRSYKQAVLDYINDKFGVQYVPLWDIAFMPTGNKVLIRKENP